MMWAIKALSILVFLAATPSFGTAGVWDSIKDGAAKTAGAVGDAAKKGANTVGNAASDGAEAITDAATPDRSRQEIDTMAANTLRELFAEQPRAKTLYDESFGYAVFDTRKMSFMITTGFGAGVAVERTLDTRTYMKMASGGVNVGMGAKWYKVVFLFQNARTFKSFLNEGWDASGGGSVVAAEEGANLGATFHHGIAVFQITDKGLMLAADLTGTKYWKDDDLNAK